MVSGLLARVRSLWRGVRRRSGVEAETDEEFRVHLELRTQHLVQDGLAVAEARSQAQREFGSLERYKDEARAARGLRYFDGLRFSWLDFKLGFRMLARYPGLAAVGGLAMAFAIWVGALGFELVQRIVFPRLPLDEGERVVALQVLGCWHERRAGPDARRLRLLAEGIDIGRGHRRSECWSAI